MCERKNEIITTLYLVVTFVCFYILEEEVDFDLTKKKKKAKKQPLKLEEEGEEAPTG